MLAYGGLTQEAFDAGQRYYEGYFVLAADLDFGGEENTWIKRLGYNYNGAENNGFKGVFDGRGHTIANVSLSEYDGLFGGVHRAATIKNVAFTGMTVSILGGIFGRECSGKLENVFIDVTFDGTDDTAVLGFYAYASAGLNNVVIALHGTLASENYAVLATGEFAGANITNCYIITNGLPIKEYSAFTVGETSVTATGLPTEYWDLSGDYPVFK